MNEPEDRSSQTISYTKSTFERQGRRSK